MSPPIQRVVLIGVGGASNSGKTTVAKHLKTRLKNSIIIHLDDFAPPISEIPYSPLYKDVQDWDTPATAIAWPRLRTTLAFFKSTGDLPPYHTSHDQLNVLPGVHIPEEQEKEFESLVREVEQAAEEKGEEIRWGILDGFLNYFDEEVISAIDIRVFLRVPYAKLKERREARSTYVTQTQSTDEAGEVWQDPPNYFDQIVYPAYVLAHSAIFTPPPTLPTSNTPDSKSPSDRVETSEPTPEWTAPVSEGGKGLVIIKPEEGEAGMGRCLVEVLRAIRERL